VSQSNIRIDEGTDKYLNAWTRTIGGTALAEQAQLEGQPTLATHYVEFYWAINSLNNDAQIFQLMGDGLRYTRILGIGWKAKDDWYAEIYDKFSVVRVSTPGTLGAVLNVSSPFEGDEYAGDARVFEPYEQYYPAQGTAATEGGTLGVLWLDGKERWLTPSEYPGAKPWTFGPSVDDGIAIRQESDGGQQDGHFYVAFQTYRVR